MPKKWFGGALIIHNQHNQHNKTFYLVGGKITIMAILFVCIEPILFVKFYFYKLFVLKLGIFFDNQLIFFRLFDHFELNLSMEKLMENLQY